MSLFQLNAVIKTRVKKAESMGFTLIELLIVIAIISLLAAILFPVFARARENARRASCQSNLKQLYLGYYQYSQDYDERLCPIIMGTPDIYWNVRLEPYLKSTGVLYCPSTKPLPATTYAINYSKPGVNKWIGGWYGTPGGTFDASGLNYGANGLIHPLRWASIDDPAGTMILCDGYDHAANAQPLFRSDYIVDPPSKRHFDGGNFAFLDGHVKWQKNSVPASMFTPELD